MRDRTGNTVTLTHLWGLTPLFSQKHADRQGSTYEATSKKAGDLNRQGQGVVDDILTNPGSVRRPNRLGGEDVVAPDGRGVRYNGDGSFRSFLEPK